MLFYLPINLFCSTKCVYMMHLEITKAINLRISEGPLKIEKDACNFIRATRGTGNRYTQFDRHFQSSMKHCLLTSKFSFLF